MSEIILSWPDKRLSPNARGHWALKAKAASSYRREGYIAAKASGVVVDWGGLVCVSLYFYPPDRRVRDDDNLVSALKSARDGIADALSVNDSRFLTLPPNMMTEVVKGGKVAVVLRQADGAVESMLKQFRGGATTRRFA